MTLFNEVENLEYLGLRLSGDPEVLHEIENYFRVPQNFFEIIRPQIKKILELVPDVFPESWKSPKTYTELTLKEQRAFQEISNEGICRCPGLVVEKVIELAIEFKKKPRNLTTLP